MLAFKQGQASSINVFCEMSLTLIIHMSRVIISHPLHGEVEAVHQLVLAHEVVDGALVQAAVVLLLLSCCCCCLSNCHLPELLMLTMPQQASGTPPQIFTASLPKPPTMPQLSQSLQPHTFTNV